MATLSSFRAVSLQVLNIRLSEQKRLNSQAIKAKLTGELSQEDFEAFKQNISDETKKIENALSALDQERKTLEELSQQAKLEKISLVSTWRTAGIQDKLELQKAMFPDGLVWSHETAFLNPKNEGLMSSLRQLFQSFGDPKESTEQLLVNFGVPDG